MLLPETQDHAAMLCIAVDNDRSALRHIQGQARYVFSEAEFANLTGPERGHGLADGTTAPRKDRLYRARP